MKQQPKTTEVRKPTHRIYMVSGEGKKSTWTPVGAAWPNKDGKGFSVNCDAFPLPVRFVIREIAQRDQIEGDQQ